MFSRSFWEQMPVQLPPVAPAVVGGLIGGQGGQGLRQGVQQGRVQAGQDGPGDGDVLHRRVGQGAVVVPENGCEHGNLLLPPVRAAHQIIDTDAVKVCQLHKHFSGNIDFPQLIFGVRCLLDSKLFCHILLRPIFVLPQITNPRKYHFLSPMFIIQ